MPSDPIGHPVDSLASPIPVMMSGYCAEVSDGKTFDAEWARCRPWIAAAMEYGYGTHTLADVEAQLREGHAQLWAGERSAMITEVIECPQAKVIHCFLAGGDLQELCVRMEPSVIAWGKAQGCSLATVNGRDGWGKVLARYGYSKSRITVVKEIG